MSIILEWMSSEKFRNLLEGTNLLAENDNLPMRLLRLAQVKAIAGIGTSTIYRKMEAGNFPRPRALSPGCVRWIEAEVQAWATSLPETGRAAA
jgi:prophage regulatory protein